MVARRLTSELAARVLVIGLALGLPLAALVARWARPDQAIEVRASVAESGGWTPADLTADVGQPLHLRLTSDDVLHGFAIGQSDRPAVDLWPGEVAEVTLTFDRPGKYVFYCTRWCGPSHWRMRGAIEVGGPTPEPVVEAPPLYVVLGIDLDAPHEADPAPNIRPSPARGEALAAAIPPEYLTRDYYLAHSPVELWRALRGEPAFAAMADSDVWDLVALVWRESTTPEAVGLGARLYAQNCAACHGTEGAGDGVMVEDPRKGAAGPRKGAAGPRQGVEDPRQGPAAGRVGWDGRPAEAPPLPADFTDPVRMLGASPALLQGKIIRGGMGTGMPYWGPIFTGPQTWAIVDYLWTFQWEYKP